MIELLMSCAEIFRYQEDPKAGQSVRGGIERRVIREIARPRTFPKFCQLEGGLAGMLQRELESYKPGCEKVLLTKEDSLHLVGVTESDFWSVEDIDPDTGAITVTRPTGSDERRPAPSPTEGYIRTYGLNGQVRLIHRRKKAIDRLDEHSYLLTALAQPGMVAMDTGAPTQAYALPADKVDQSKRAVIEDIERVRPIYTLQGPPGTGKTTLVAYKLRRLFDDDPLAQVLVTAQGHDAVDVLRGKVRNEAFEGVPPDRMPLAIRLGGRAPTGAAPDEDSVESKSLNLLEQTRKELAALRERSPLQQRWLDLLDIKLAPELDRAGDGFFQTFTQLVKRGASITYSTTSAAGLAELVEGSQTFDWSFDWVIVEEAGKVHGFDLALPLQTGHRWLLPGDQKQLEPFGMDSFKKALNDLDGAVQALSDLPDRAFVDHEWLQGWREQIGVEESQNFVEYVRRWLPTFAQLFKMLKGIHGEERLTTTEACGGKAGMLALQWRMHPEIGNLISSVFYHETPIRSATVLEDGSPAPKVCHRLRLRGATAEEALEGRAIVWIDTPWAGIDPTFQDIGPAQHKPRYTNPSEAKAIRSFLNRLECIEPDQSQEIVVLSPYSRQVGALNSALREFQPAAGFRKVPVAGRSGSERWAHTVDSFQGNQADVVIVSLVRNNPRDDGFGLGFLKEKPRLNVLLSRAEKLLVLVGSFAFFERQARTVALDNTEGDLWFWARALELLQQSFSDGRALRIPAQNLVP